MRAARGTPIVRPTPLSTLRRMPTGPAAEPFLPDWTGNTKLVTARRVSELASSLTRNQVPRKGLGVRVPCPPLATIGDNLFIHKDFVQPPT